MKVSLTTRIGFEAGNAGALTEAQNFTYKVELSVLL